MREIYVSPRAGPCVISTSSFLHGVLEGKTRHGSDPAGLADREGCARGLLARLDERDDDHLLLTFPVRFANNELGHEKLTSSAGGFVKEMEQSPEAVPFKKLMKDVVEKVPVKKH